MADRLTLTTPALIYRIAGDGGSGMVISSPLLRIGRYLESDSAAATSARYTGRDQSGTVGKVEEVESGRSNLKS